MYTLLSKNILKNYRVSNKTIKNRSIVINDVNSLLLLPVGSTVVVFFEHSISLAHLKDLKSALNLDITLVVNNQGDYDLAYRMFKTRLVTWDYIDGELVGSILLNDEKQLEALSSGAAPKSRTMSLSGLVEDARKMVVTSAGTESSKLVASAFINTLDSMNENQKVLDETLERNKELETQNLMLRESLNGMATDMDDFIRMYKVIQSQIASRNVLDVIRDNSSVQLPSSVTSLVIKNFGTPYLNRFVRALKDALTTSFDKYTKVLYIIEPDSASIQELNRKEFFLLTSETKASDLLKHDMLLCVGNTREPIEFLMSSSAMDILIVIDSRRNTTELISGQSLTMYAAPDLETAMNLNLDPQLTITNSEKSVYTLRESDFTSKKRHVLRNNELVLRVANSLVGL